MTISQNMLGICLLTSSLFFTFADAGATEPPAVRGSTAVDASSDLYKAIMAKDYLLFTVAFNDCDETELNRLFDDDFEFYHDKGGPTITKDEFIKMGRERRCEQKIYLERRLITESMKIFPLYKKGQLYGAVQTGDHDFYIKDQNGALKLVETATFTTLWMKRGEDWKMSRALSYNHVSVD